MIAAEIANLDHGQRQTGKFAAVPTQAEAAAMLQVSERSIRSATAVQDHGAPELIAEVEAGNVSVSADAERTCLNIRLRAERRVSGLLPGGTGAGRTSRPQPGEKGIVRWTDDTLALRPDPR